MKNKSGGVRLDEGKEVTRVRCKEYKRKVAKYYN